MASDDPIRASDSDRDAVVATLREAYMAGRLTLEEFNERMTAAYASKTWGDLRALTADLPASPVLGGDADGRPPARSPRAGEPLVPYQPMHAKRRRPVAILIPVAVWTLIALNGAGHGLATLLILMLMISFFAAALRRR